MATDRDSTSAPRAEGTYDEQRAQLDALAALRQIADAKRPGNPFFLRP